jgi:hypothetical protein
MSEKKDGRQRGFHNESGMVMQNKNKHDTQRKPLLQQTLLAIE